MIKLKLREEKYLMDQIEILKNQFEELPFITDESGKRKTYFRLNPEERLQMDRAVSKQSYNMNERRMLQAEILAIKNPRAVEILQQLEDDTVYLLIEKEKSTDYIVLDIFSDGTYHKYDLTEKEWWEIKKETLGMNNLKIPALNYEIVR